MTSLRGNNGPRYRHAADESAPYETIGVDKLTPIIGAEISGADLSGALSNRQMDEIHRVIRRVDTGGFSSTGRVTAGSRKYLDYSRRREPCGVRAPRHQGS